MNLKCRIDKTFDLNLRLNELEAGCLMTLLYHATNDLVLDREQLALANDIMVALNPSRIGEVRSNGQ